MLKKRTNIRSQKASYILELAILTPLALGFCLGLAECFNLARAYVSLQEAINFGMRELASVNGRGVNMSKPKSLATYNWVQYRIDAGKLSKQTIARAVSEAPQQCNQVDSSNTGCVAELNYLPPMGDQTKRTVDFNKIYNTLIKPELSISKLPDLKFNCKNKNKPGCFDYKFTLQSATANSSEKINLEFSYNSPTPYLKFITGQDAVRLTVSLSTLTQTELLERDPQIINEDLKY